MNYPYRHWALVCSLASFGIYAISAVAFAQQENGPATMALSAGSLEQDEELTIDGLVIEEAWTRIEPYTGFIQQAPFEGRPATEKTEVRVILDRKTFYIGIICFDSDPRGVLVTQSRRDGDLNESDSIQVVLDTFNDNQNAFLFGTNPVGIEYDGQIASEGRTGQVFTGQAGGGGSRRGDLSGYNPNWDGDWVVQSQITDRGWETEMAIPLKTLRYNAGADRTWGFNVVRNIRRKNEQVFLASIPRGYDIYRVSLAAKMSGLDLPGRRDIKITPYVVGKADRNNLVTEDQVESEATAGVDVKWGVTPQLTADFTVNTDFAQVEADEEQINLTRFPLFFPEKRSFFLENASTFQFGIPQQADLFFSRRIGLANGVPVGIVAGARLTGKVGAWNLGLLDMQTETTFRRRTDDLLTPANNFFVSRVQREIGRSNVGAIFVNRQATGDFAGSNNYNRAYGVDSAIQMTENTKLYTFLAGTTSPDPVGTDYAGRALVQYANNLYSWALGYNQIGERFNPEVGFLPRRGYRQPRGRFFLNYQPKKYPWIRRYIPHVLVFAEYGFDGELQSSREHYHPLDFQPQAGGQFGFVLDRFRDVPKRDFPVFIGPDGKTVIIPPGRYTWNEWKLEYFGNPSARFFVNSTFTWGGFYDGDQKAFTLSANIQLGAKLQASVGWNRDDIKLPDGAFTVDLVPIKFNYSFTPLASLSALIQYNSTTASISSNIRLALLNRSGTGFFVVYNDRRDTFRRDRFIADSGLLIPNVLGRSFIVKYTRLFDF